MGVEPLSEDASAAPAPTFQREIVVVGASAGGVEALASLVRGFPPELPAAVFVVLHVMPGGTSVLPQILARNCRLAVESASDGEQINRGRIYVAPPDHHILIADGRVVLTRGPRENGHRPAIDPLFRSAARAYGPRVVGVVLSGTLDDGAAGLRMIGDAGGTAVVQDPAEALYSGMPRSALEHEPRARIASIGQMADVICHIIDEPVPNEAVAGTNPGMRVDHSDRSDGNPRTGTLSEITCPECGGALWEHDENGVVRFKCHVGHAFSAGSLEVAQSQALEMALWAALRSLQERADLFRRLARRAGGSARLEEKAKTADDHAKVLRRVVTSIGREPGESDEAHAVGG